MKNDRIDIPILIVGGGPVGLFLAITLQKKGIGCKVLEKRKEPVPDSRSLGIHPVSLELFDKIGITKPFLEKGLKIRKGIALSGRKVLGKIEFTDCPKPHNYILACPQFTTEEILRKELKKLDPQALISGASFESFLESDTSITAQFVTKNGANQEITSEYIVGCDGKNSQVRQAASIHYSGKRYPDTYIMGDFEDTTNFGSDAAVYLPPGGLVECFPLPNGMRRWVVKTDEYISAPTDAQLALLVEQRLGTDISGIQSQMLSSFGVQHYMAETFAKGRVLLAGDAAHVVSPIGGQGMNLGWLDAWELANLFSNKNAPSDFHLYSKQQQKITKKVARRAELNMILGRKSSIPFIKELFIKGMLHSPFKQKIAEVFTMRGLSNWWL